MTSEETTATTARPATPATPATTKTTDASPSLPVESAQTSDHAAETADHDREASEPGEKDEKEKDKDTKDDEEKHDAKDDTKDVDEKHATKDASPPPLPDEPVPDVQEDDGWDPMWSEEHKTWFFYNRFTQKTQWENPRVPEADASASASASSGMPELPPGSVAGGYNPAIHGDYDPNAWYAKGTHNAAGGDGLGSDDTEDTEAAIAAAVAAANAALQGPQSAEYRYSGEAKARRQMNAYFDVDAAASEHDGRSLKAERSGKKPTRAELKAFKEKRRARKEEKRRAWLRD